MEESGLYQGLLTKGTAFLDGVSSKSAWVTLKIVCVQSISGNKNICRWIVNWKEVKRKGCAGAGSMQKSYRIKKHFQPSTLQLIIHIRGFYIAYLIAKCLAHSLSQSRKFCDSSTRSSGWATCLRTGVDLQMRQKQMASGGGRKPGMSSACFAQQEAVRRVWTAVAITKELNIFYFKCFRTPLWVWLQVPM